MAIPGNDVFFASIAELNARLVKKEFFRRGAGPRFRRTPGAARPRYNALALSLKEQALRQARTVDKDFKSGLLRGPLQGVPYAVKDLLSYAGLPTTWGARPYAGQVFDFNAKVIDKLSSVGSVIVGKLSMVELAGGAGTGPRRFALRPRTQSVGPHALVGRFFERPCRGGRGRLVPFAIGSETSGSIVTPAAFCGVTALRPTYGLVSRHGAMALSWTLDKLGPFARSAEDCGLILHAIAGKDGQDPGSAGKSFYYTPQYARPLDRCGSVLRPPISPTAPTLPRAPPSPPRSTP